ncbi:MAG: hypothetical protein CVU44_03930 [Chloroflexi bacterium HGW-Chloroflexi-6]|nr:MAG: hypothetical protein CVU44_03930 [Chloroflexi bacterium HGW-Chloroflexi-6]
MKSLARLFVIVFVLSLLVLPAGGVLAQEEPSRYFSQTGHNVSGDFLRFYDSVANAEQIFGYPLTEAFTDAKSGRLIQYFTRTRFEFYPEQLDGQRVRISTLGEYLYQPGGQLNLFTPIGCRTFPNDKAVCYDFLDFFEKNGGEAVFGYPISGFEFLNERIVQHFQNARFEWYPENPEGSKVVLADLGRAYFSFAAEDPTRLTPASASQIIEVLSIQARAFSWKAVTQANDVQTVYVIVQDQTLSPVQDAIAVVTIYFPNGTPRSVSLPTNQYGVVIIPFEVVDQPPGSLVTVYVQVYYQGKTSSAVTSFRIWK